MNPKKTITMPNAKPESSAALRVMVYFAHQADALFLIK
ncbi:hypothetical protein PC116_g34422 [Phytophthora cactorum]|nr:hypothetical protein PC116_g34422 [Phytophthora cactorum]